MKPWMKKVGWWIAVLSLGAAYFYLQWQDFEEEQRERQENRIREEVSEKVGKSLRESSKKRQEKLQQDLANLWKKDAGPQSPDASTVHKQ